MKSKHQPHAKQMMCGPRQDRPERARAHLGPSQDRLSGSSASIWWSPLRASRPVHRGIPEGDAFAKGLCLHQPRGALLLLLYCLVVPSVSPEAGSGACQPYPKMLKPKGAVVHRHPSSRALCTGLGTAIQLSVSCSAWDRHRTTLCLPHAEATLLRCVQQQHSRRLC